nr:hypothetical protein HK105_007369 [Polyrhizophydium stewartii]
MDILKSSTSCDKDATSSSSKRNYIGSMPHYSELLHLGFHFVCTMDFNRKNYVMIRIAPIDPNCDYPGEKPKTKRGVKKMHHGAIFVKICEAEDGKADIFDDMLSIKGPSIANVEKLFKFLAADVLPVTGSMLDGKGCRLREITRYYACHVFRRMHMESHSARQHWPAHVQDCIYAMIERLRPAWDVKNSRKTKDGPPTSRILFAIGDGDSEHNSRGHLTMPTATPLFDALQQQCETVCWVDGHRTTKKKSKETKRIECKAKSLAKLASKRIRQGNPSILPRLLPITQEEADRSIKFARSEATSEPPAPSAPAADADARLVAQSLVSVNAAVTQNLLDRLGDSERALQAIMVETARVQAQLSETVRMHDGVLRDETMMRRSLAESVQVLRAAMQSMQAQLAAVAGQLDLERQASRHTLEAAQAIAASQRGLAERVDAHAAAHAAAMSALAGELAALRTGLADARRQMQADAAAAQAAATALARAVHDAQAEAAAAAASQTAASEAAATARAELARRIEAAAAAAAQALDAAPVHARVDSVHARVAAMLDEAAAARKAEAAGVLAVVSALRDLVSHSRQQSEAAMHRLLANRIGAVQASVDAQIAELRTQLEAQLRKASRPLIVM